MKISKVLAPAAVVAVLAVGASACGTDSSTNDAAAQAYASQRAAQGQDSNNLSNNQPNPVYTYSQALDTLQKVQDIEANGENTTSFGITNNGLLMWQCSSIGMPVPADAQLSNPDAIIADPNNTNNNNGNPGSVVVAQPDPIGYYTGPTTGTFSLCVDSKGHQYVQYWEGYVDAVSGPAVFDNTTHTVKLLGDPIQLPTHSKVNTPTPKK